MSSLVNAKKKAIVTEPPREYTRLFIEAKSRNPKLYYKREVIHHDPTLWGSANHLAKKIKSCFDDLHELVGLNDERFTSLEDFLTFSKAKEDDWYFEITYQSVHGLCTSSGSFENPATLVRLVDALMEHVTNEFMRVIDRSPYRDRIQHMKDARVEDEWSVNAMEIAADSIGSDAYQKLFGGVLLSA